MVQNVCGVDKQQSTPSFAYQVLSVCSRFVHMHTHVHTCTHAHTHMHTHMHTTHTCTHMHTHVHTCTDRWSRSLEDLAGYTAKLESRALHYDLCSGSPHDLRNKTGPPADGDTGGPSVGRPGDTGGPSVGGPGDTEGPSVGGPGDTGGPSVGGPGEQEKVQCTANQKRKRRNKMAAARRNKMATARRSSVQGLAGPVTNAKSGGCIKCHQDSDYAQVPYGWSCMGGGHVPCTNMHVVINV